MINILILQKEEMNKKYEKINDINYWYANMNTTNANRLFFTNSINYLFIIYHDNKDTLTDVKKLFEIYKNICKINYNNIIFYVISKDNIKKPVLEYLNKNYINLNIIIEKTNNINKLINNLIN